MIRILILILFLNLHNVFGQINIEHVPTWELHEIQLFNGKTPGGTHIIKIDKSGILLRKIDIYNDDNCSVDIITFNNLKGKEKDEFKTNYRIFLNCLDTLALMTYIQSVPTNDTISVDSTTIIKRIVSNFHHYRNLKILVIDQSFNTRLLTYQNYDRIIAEFIKIVNNLLPESVRDKYHFELYYMN